jgi:hypothetical protein
MICIVRNAYVDAWRKTSPFIVQVLYQRRLPTGIAFAPLTPAERLTTTESTTAAATVAAISAASTPTTVPSHLGETRINVLLSLLEDTHEITGLLRIVSGEEGDGCAFGAGTASSADAVDVVLRVVGVVIVEHMSNVAHIFERKEMVSNGLQHGRKQPFQHERTAYDTDN